MDDFTKNETYRLCWRKLILITAFGLSMLSINLGGVRVLTFHETVFAQPAKEMLATGRWVLPRIAGEPFLDRTPLTAWTIAASMTIFGSDAEWVVRLPAVLFGVATALLIGMMTARWFGERAGLLAALIELTTVQMLTFARLAEADTLLCLTVTAAMYFFALGNVSSPRGRIESRWLPVAFYAALAASFMVKWLFGPAFIGLGCFAYCLVARERRAWKFLFNPLGIAASLFLTLPWLVAAYREYPPLAAAFIDNHFRRFDGGMGAREPWFAYFYLVPFLLLPWIPYAVPTIVSRLRSHDRREPFWTFALCWFLPGMTLLSLSAFKAKHYAIPLHAPLIVAAAVGLHEYLVRRERAAGRLLPWAIGASLIGGMAVIGLLLVKRPNDYLAMVGITAVAASGGAVSLRFDQLRRWKPQLGVAFATLWIAVVGVQTFIMPSHDSFRPLAELGRRAADFVPEGTTVHLVSLPEVQIPYYIARPQRRWDLLESFDPHAAAATSNSGVQPSEIFVVTSRDFLAVFQAKVGRVEVLDSATRTAHHTFDRDRLVLLRVGVADCGASTAQRPEAANLR